MMWTTPWRTGQNAGLQHRGDRSEGQPGPPIGASSLSSAAASSLLTKPPYEPAHIAKYGSVAHNSMSARDRHVEERLPLAGSSLSVVFTHCHVL